MHRGLQAKMDIMRQYPDIGGFVIRAFYEKDPEISSAIQESCQKYFSFKASATLMNLDPEQFVPGLDLRMMYQDMYWASEGYLMEMVQRDSVDVEQMEADFEKMIEFWKQIYLRKEG